jgi:hypothetical protein
MNRKEKQEKLFKKELKNALISIKEVITGKRKEVILEEFLENPDEIEFWSREELKQISTYMPPSWQSNEDFSEWYAMPAIE